MQEIYSLEQLSTGDSCVHRLHPAAKILATLFFLIVVLSFSRYEIAGLTPYLFYTFTLAALADTPHSIMLKRFALALPFCLLAGIGNVLFDRGTAFHLGGFAASYGAVSLLAILFRAYLCVTAVLLLIATTPFVQLSAQLRRMHVPGILATLFEMTYRYLGTLAGEASSMYTAYMLRAPRHKGLNMRHMGSFVGQLLIRSFDRAERVYGAMMCRGYTARDARRDARPLALSDWAYLAAVCGACVLFRLVDIPGLIGDLVVRLS